MDANNSKLVFICNNTDAYTPLINRLISALERDGRVLVSCGASFSCAPGTPDIILYTADRTGELPAWKRSRETKVLLLTQQDIYDAFSNKLHDDKNYNYAFVLPSDCDLIAHRILSLLFDSSGDGFVYRDKYFVELEHRAGKLLKSLGVPLRLDGYYYLRFVLAYSYLRPNAVWKTEVYPKLKKRFNKSASCTERSMRYAIEYAWTHGDINAQHAIFGYTIDLEKGKPILRELAAMLADRMRIENIR